MQTDYAAKTDGELVEACKKADDLAFKELMERHVRSVFNFARQYGKTDDEVDDIVQDTFFKAWRHIKRFKAGRPWKPWLFTIARNTALDHVKKRRAWAFSELDDADNDLAFADTLEDAEPLPPAIFEQAELTGELTAVMGSLHPEHRAVLLMHYREDMTFDEIAEVTGRPMNTVKSWHRRALQKIRPMLPHRQPQKERSEPSHREPS